MKPFSIGALLCCLIGNVSAQEQTLTTYTTLSAPAYVDAGSVEVSAGDMKAPASVFLCDLDCK